MSTEAAVPETVPNLYQRLNLVMRDVGAMPKTGQNKSQDYKFIEQSLMMAILRPLFVEHGIVILPEILATEWHRPEGAKQTTARCGMRFTLINADNPADKAECLWSSEGADMGDKGVNKAGTSGEKYFLMKLLMLSDKDDPDAEPVPAPQQQAGRQSAAAPARPAKAKKADSEPAGEEERAYVIGLAHQLDALGGSAPPIPTNCTIGVLRTIGTTITNSIADLKDMERHAPARIPAHVGTP